MSVSRFGLAVRSAAVATVCALSAHAALAGGSDPEVVLDEIFGQVDAMCSADGQGVSYDIYAIAETYFVPDLATAFTQAMASGLGFDILVDGQDCETRDLTLEVLDTGGDMATGRASFTNMGEARIIDLKMTKTGDAWKVSDVVYQHRPFVLSDEVR